MAAHILAAYREDIQIRLHGGEPSNKTGYRVNAHEIKAGVVYRDANVTVTAFRVPHGDWKEAFGYRFDTSDGRSIVISGDTGPSDAVVQACHGCDVLVHEVYSTAGFKRRPVEWQKYHARYHTSSEELACDCDEGSARGAGVDASVVLGDERGGFVGGGSEGVCGEGG